MPTFEMRSNGERSAIFELGKSWDVAEALLEHKPAEFHRFLGAVHADSWIEAKERLGEELTPLQKAILDGTATAYELFGRDWGFVDLTQIFPVRPYVKRGGETPQQKWRR